MGSNKNENILRHEPYIDHSKNYLAMDAMISDNVATREEKVRLFWPFGLYESIT